MVSYVGKQKSKNWIQTQDFHVWHFYGMPKKEIWWIYCQINSIECPRWIDIEIVVHFERSCQTSFRFHLIVQRSFRDHVMALLKAILGSRANFVPNVGGMIGGLRKKYFNKVIIEKFNLNFTITSKYGYEKWVAILFIHTNNSLLLKRVIQVIIDCTECNI